VRLQKLALLIIATSSTALLLAPSSVAAVSSYVAPKQADLENFTQGSKKSKAPKVIPSKPYDLSGNKLKPHLKSPLVKPNQTSSSTQTLSLLGTTSTTVTADTSPPVMSGSVSASTVSITTINAQWNPAQDPESGISYYVYGIGTKSTGDYNTLANVKWWQVTYDTKISDSISLDPNTTYYVTAYAVNGANLSSPMVISNPVKPTWQNLGQPGNVVTIQFAPNGYDENGNTTTGWTSDQVTQFTTFFNKMYPLIEQLYGPPADTYTVTVVRDLRYHSSNAFIPSSEEIRMDDGFYPQLFTHELIHAFRNTHILSTNQKWEYDSTLSGFEEGFAQAVSYEAMNQYVAAYPNDNQVAGNTLWGSTDDWDYDFQNMPILKGTDFWSESGGTGLYWLKYEMAAAAIRKINIESPDFYKRFNQEYYARINADPVNTRSSRALIVDIIKSLVPKIEGQDAKSWVDRQNIFFTQNVYGKKIYDRVQNYEWSEYFAFHKLYFLDTMSCGSEWACWDGQQWVYYHLNGSLGSGNLVNSTGNTIWSGSLSILPAANPSDGNYTIGNATKNLTTASTLLPWPGGDPEEYIMNLTDFGLYKFNSTFIDSATGQTTTNSIYSMVGSSIAKDFKGVWGGVIGHKNGVIYINHEGYADEAAIPVSNGAFAGARSWTGIPNTRTNGYDSVPGKVFITFKDTDTGTTYQTQRNIDIGSVDGSQMLLIDFANEFSRDVTPPSVSIKSPSAGQTVSNTVTIQANAADDVGVAKVEFYVDGNLLSTSTASPYSTNWNTATVALGTHTLTAKAFDQEGNSTLSSAVSVNVADTTVPSVSITNPLNGSSIAKGSKVTISANSTDDRQVKKVEFYVNNKLLCTLSAGPYTCSWTLAQQKGVQYVVMAKAYDTSNNQSQTSSTVTSK
jgi:hypothetical protein